MQKFSVNNLQVGKRLDIVCYNALIVEMPTLTRSQIKNAIDNNQIKVNGKIEKAGYKVLAKDIIDVELSSSIPHYLEKQNIPLNIIFEDNNFVVINKPQGMVVHPGNGNLNNTLVNALLFKYNEIEKNFNINKNNIENVNELRPGIVHRIDKNTSGLLVVAKTQFALNSLSNQIAQHQCKREYVAICEGIFKEQNGTITSYICRNKRDKTKMAVCKESEGKLAITHYVVLKQFEKCAYVQFNLETGRTHQIRVHAKYINHPIVGDNVYNKQIKGLNGQLLHARKLTFISPTTGKWVTFEASIPDYFENYLKKLN